MTDPAAGQVEVPAPPEPAGPDGPNGTAPDELGPDGIALDDAAPGDAGPDGGPVDPDGSTDPNGPVDVEQVDQPVDTAAGPAAPMADFRMALVTSVTMDLPSQHPTVLLRELESPRRQLSFSIGLPDAVALAHALRRIATPRPLTHELVSGILQGFDIDVVAVRLVGRRGSIYFAELDLRGRTGRSVLSARPSDALTLALLQPVPAPILIDVRLLEDAGDVPPPG
jgi:bifunctional DNase/RNase